MRWLNQLVGWIFAFVAILWRATNRVTHVDDPRPALRAEGKGAAIAMLHAHQLSALMGFDEPRLCVMISRSRDGDLMIPAVRAAGIHCARGSAQKKGRDKGGTAALAELSEFARDGGFAILTIDGPQGPRNRVKRGVVSLAVEIGVPVIPLVMVPSRRWIFSRTWDRLQIPTPFSRITFTWGAPIAVEGRERREIRIEAEEALRALERRADPAEGKRADTAADAL